MILANLLPGQAVFLDANTLVYHFQPHPVFGAACNRLMQRIEQQDLIGYTSTHILTEVAHRLMILEAGSLPGWPRTKIKQRLRQQPSALQNLIQFRQAVESVLQSRIQVLTIPAPLIGLAAGLSQQTGLLSNDALIVAIMQQHGLTNLASADGDFDRVPGLTRFAPA